MGWDCEGGSPIGGGCRRKRSTAEGDPGDHADLTLHLNTEEPVLSGLAKQGSNSIDKS